MINPLPDLPVAIYRTIRDVFDSYPRRFNKSKARGLRSILHLDLSSDDSGLWTVFVSEEGVSVREGLLDEPEILIECRGRDWVELSNNRLTGMEMMIAGQLTIKGPLIKLVKIQNLLEAEVAREDDG